MAMTDIYDHPVSFHSTKVKLKQNKDPSTGFQRDVEFLFDKGNRSEYIRHGLLNSSLLHEALIWVIGTHQLQLYEDYPELIEQSFFCFDQLSSLQEALASAYDTYIKYQSQVSETIYRYELATILRASLTLIDQNNTDPLIIYNTAGNAIRACLYHMDEHDETVSLAEPEALSLSELYESGHLARLNNQTAPTIAQWMAHQKTTKPKASTQEESLSWGGYRYLKFSLVITGLVILPKFLNLILTGLLSLFSAYTLSCTIIAVALGSAFLGYLIQISPKENQSQLLFIVESAQSILTLITCLWMLSNFFYPFNPINTLLCQLLPITYPLAASISILLSMATYTVINALLHQITEAKKDNVFPDDTQKEVNHFLLYVHPYRNKVWQWLQKPSWYFALLPACLVLALVLAHFGILGQIIGAFEIVFDVSRMIALLTLFSLIYYGRILSKSIDQPTIDKPAPRQTHDWLAVTFMLGSFFAIMAYIFSIDYAILNSTFSIIGILFNLKATTIGATSIILLACACIAIVALLPKNLKLKEAFKRNPLQQAEHIFIEVNTFYYLYGLRHPLVMVLFIGLFILSFASFYNLIVPSYIANFAYQLAIALVSESSGVSFLAFTASLMIGNILIISYDILTMGKRSYIAKLAKLCELYSLDVLIVTTLSLFILNLFILIPYIQSHLGTIAMIGSLSFLFKIAVISYDFQRDKHQKSFFAACLTCLLWPFYAMKTLYHEPKLETLIDLAYALEKSIIHCLLVFIYDIVFKIFLRIFEVMLYAISNVLLVIAQSFHLTAFSLSFTHFKQQSFKYLDFFRISAKTTIFKNEAHYRLWHLCLVIFLVIIGFECMSHGLGLTVGIMKLFTNFQLHPISISYLLYANPVVQSLFLVQVGVAIILLLTLGLVKYIGYSHEKQDLSALKTSLLTHTRHQLICVISLSLTAALLGFVSSAYIPVLQVTLIFLSILIQHQLTLPNIITEITTLIYVASEEDNQPGNGGSPNVGESLIDTLSPLKSTAMNQQIRYTQPGLGEPEDPLTHEDENNQGPDPRRRLSFGETL